MEIKLVEKQALFRIGTPKQERHVQEREVADVPFELSQAESSLSQPDCEAGTDVSGREVVTETRIDKIVGMASHSLVHISLGH